MLNREVRLFLASLSLLSAAPTAALAQADRTWVSRTGSDSNACSANAPCASFDAAYRMTNPGGVVTFLDSGVYSAGTAIRKALTVQAMGVDASILGYFIVDVGATDKVAFDGLDMFGKNGPTATYNNGILIRSAGEVRISHCRIRAYRDGVSVFNLDSGVRLMIDDSRIEDNLMYGISVQSPDNMGHAKIMDSLILSNGIAGIKVTGTGNDVLLANVKMLGNPKALDIGVGASARSYGNNVLTSGDAPTTVPLN
jgi:hypothetical protein